MWLTASGLGFKDFKTVLKTRAVVSMPFGIHTHVTNILANVMAERTA